MKKLVKEIQRERFSSANSVGRVLRCSQQDLDIKKSVQKIQIGQRSLLEHVDSVPKCYLRATQTRMSCRAQRIQLSCPYIVTTWRRRKQHQKRELQKERKNGVAACLSIVVWQVKIARKGRQVPIVAIAERGKAREENDMVRKVVLHGFRRWEYTMHRWDKTISAKIRSLVASFKGAVPLWERWPLSHRRFLFLALWGIFIIF